MIHHAQDLRSAAQEKRRLDREDMDAWVENLSESITDACQEAADDGEMEVKFSVEDDLVHFMDADVPEDKIDEIIRGTAKMLEQHGYKVLVDDFNPKTKSQAEITAITVDWSGR